MVCNENGSNTRKASSGPAPTKSVRHKLRPTHKAIFYSACGLGVQPHARPFTSLSFAVFFYKQFLYNHLKLKNMNTIIGRITRDAVVKNLKDDRQVVEFSVA